MVLDDEYEDVEEVTIEPTVTVDWEHFSEGISSFDIEIESVGETISDEENIAVDVDEDSDFQAPDSWESYDDDLEDETVTVLDIDGVSDGDDEAVESVDGDLSESDGTATIDSLSFQVVVDHPENTSNSGSKASIQQLGFQANTGGEGTN